MEKYIEQGKDFIENELHYSFKSMETMTVAKRLLKAFMKGFEIAKEYWQKGVYSQEQVDELLDQQVSITTAQMLGKFYSEEEVIELLKKFDTDPKVGYFNGDYTRNKWFGENKKKIE